MTQATSYQVPAHPSGLDMRTQLNVIVLALLGDNAGPTAPTETYPGMMWGDTTAMRLRRRTNANDAWINIGPLDNFLGDITNQINTATANKVTKTGDTMTGQLTMSNGAVTMYQAAGGANYGYVGPYGTPGAAGSGMGFVNSALNAWNFQVSDDGTAVLRNTMNINGACWVNGGRLWLMQPGSYGEICFYSTDRTAMFLRGRTGGGGMEWINNAYNAVVGTMDDGGNVSFGQINSRGIGVFAGEVQSGNGGGRLGTDGNLYMGWCGDWLSNQLGAKAPNGAQVQWNSGISELASAMGGNNTVDGSNPWVMEGVRVTTSSDINRIYPRIVWLRNA